MAAVTSRAIKRFSIGGFHLTSRRPCWCTEQRCKMSFGNLTLLLYKTCGVIFYCFLHQHGRLITWSPSQPSFGMSRHAPPKGGGAFRDIPKDGCEGEYLITWMQTKNRIHTSLQQLWPCLQSRFSQSGPLPQTQPLEPTFSLLSPRAR